MLAPLAQRPKIHAERPERRQRHLVANLLHGHRRPHGVLLFDLISRRVIVLAPREMHDGVGHRVTIPRQDDVGYRAQRVHHRDQVERAELILDEPGQRLAQRHARPEAHVVVVQEEDENARVLALRLELLIVVAANLTRRPLARRGCPGDPDELERFDGLKVPVLEDVEVLHLQVGDRVAVLVGDDDVDTDEVDAAAEDGLLRLGRLLCHWRGRGWRRWLLRALARPRGVRAHDAGGDNQQHQQQSEERSGQSKHGKAKALGFLQ